MHTETTEDQVLRAMTDDGSFRVMTAITTNTVAEVVRLQNPPPSEAKMLGGLIAGTILVRETMSPSLRVQGIVRGANSSGTLVADSHPDGTTRGLVSLREGVSSLVLGNDATLMMMRMMPTGRPHHGVVSLKQGRDISQALMVYMQHSEQVKSMIDVACVIHDGKVLAAGGYVVQLLPDLTESQLAVMTERLASFPSMDELLKSGETASRVLSELLYGMPYTQLDDSPLRFECKCSQDQVMSSLATLGEGELGELAQGGEPLSISCEYCQKEYTITSEEVTGLMQLN